MSGKMQEDARKLLDAGYSEANAARMLTRTYGVSMRKAQEIVASVKDKQVA